MSITKLRFVKEISVPTTNIENLSSTEIFHTAFPQHGFYTLDRVIAYSELDRRGNEVWVVELIDKSSDIEVPEKINDIRDLIQAGDIVEAKKRIEELKLIVYPKHSVYTEFNLLLNKVVRKSFLEKESFNKETASVLSLGNTVEAAFNCTIAPSGFSGERVFKVTLYNGETYESLTGRHFCWDKFGKELDLNEPKKESPGLVACTILNYLEEDEVIIRSPENVILSVNSKILASRPKKI